MVSYVAGIDSSTQSCKVAIVDASTGELIRSGRAPHPAGTEVDPEAWWDALMLAIADAGGLDDVLAVSVAGQQHGLVALDASGVVVRDALLWNDVRSESAAQALTDELGAEYLASTTGLLPVSSFTVSKLRWLRDAEPENAGRVAAVALPHDWLTWRLRGYGPTGRLGPNLAALTTDRSDASGTGYWSPLSGSYVTEILENALGGAPILPDVLEPAAIAGYTQAYGQVPSGLIVAAGSGDNAAAALGLGAQAGDVFISIGTSGTVFAVSNTPTCDVTGTVAGFADASGLFLPLVATLNAAQVVDTVASLLGVSHDEFSRLALSSVPGADGVLLTPYFAGERTPNLPQATASFASLTYRNTTRANLARAAVEGMLQGLAVGLDALAQHSVRAERLTLIGGGAKLRATQQIATEVFHRNVIVPPPAEYVALGAALQASWAMLGERPTWSATSTVVRSR